MGKPIEQAVGEVEFSAAIYEYYADNAREAAGRRADRPARRRRLGVHPPQLGRRCCSGSCRGTTPTTRWPASPARTWSIGNTILLKHAPQCPESAAAMEQIFHDAGVPTDAYINIYATNEQIAVVIADPRVQGVSLTGSGRAGAAVAEIAGRQPQEGRARARRLRPVPRARDRRPRRGRRGRRRRRAWRTPGQACNAAKRFIVARRALRRVRGEVHRRADRRSSRATRRRRTRRSARCRRPPRPTGSSSRSSSALDDGATLVAGGGREGNFFKTAVLTDITPDNPAYTEEFFGPVAQVYKVGSEDEAVRAGQRHALRPRLLRLHHRPDQALRVADQIEAGMVFINAVGAEGVELPFGGVKALRLRPRARPLRRGRVRQQEAHPRRRLSAARAAGSRRAGSGRSAVR